MKKKVVVISLLVVLGLVVAAGLLFWRMMSRPLYVPGNVRAGKDLRSPLDPPPQEGAAPGFWKVEKDVSLSHFSEGAGEDVLTVHGGPGFPPLAPWTGAGKLAGRYRFHYYDQRGCGRSSRPVERFAGKSFYANMLEANRVYGLGAQVADIERIRRVLGKDRLVVVGHSFGAFIAALWAAEFPEHVKGLVLVSPAALLRMPAGTNLFDEIKTRLPPGELPGYEAFLGRYFDFKRVFTMSDRELAKMNAELGRYYLMAIERQGFAIPEGSPEEVEGAYGGWMVQGMYLSMGQKHDYRGALAHVAAPALVLHGSRDLMPQADSETYRAALPSARLVVVRGAGHFAFEERPDDFAAAVGKFLDGL